MATARLEYVSMQLIEREGTIIDLPTGPAPHYFPISPPPPFLATLGVFGTPPPWDSPPLSALDTPFFCPPHPCSHTGAVRARNSLKLGHRVEALWPHNDKMVYNILVHYKPFYSGQYRDKVLTKAV